MSPVILVLLAIAGCIGAAYLGLNVWYGWPVLGDVWKDKKSTAFERLVHTAILVALACPIYLLFAMRDASADSQKRRPAGRI